MRIGRPVLAEIRGREAIAARVLVGVFVEVRHLRAGSPAGDHLDQLLAGQGALVQVRSLARRTWIAAPIAIDPMAELAIRLVLKQTLAERSVLARSGGYPERKAGRRKGDGFDNRLPGWSACVRRIL